MGGSRATHFDRTTREMRLTERGDCKTPKELHTPLSHPHLLYSAISVTARNDSSPDAKTHVVASAVQRERVGRANTRRVRGEPLLLPQF